MPETPAPEGSAPAVGAPDRFVHLHVHSEYSILDGLNDAYTLVRVAGHAGQPALAITDHGRLSGTTPFAEAIRWYNRVHAERHEPSEGCAKNGCHSVAECKSVTRCPKRGTVPDAAGHAVLPPIRPIYGLETYVAHHGRETREKGDWGHLVLLAQNETGWANLRQLASRASLEGFYSKPRVDWALLEEHQEGLIALSACLGGHLANVWREGGETAADALIRDYAKLFGPERYFLELQWHNDQSLDEGAPARSREQWELNRYLIGASRRTGVPCVMTNDLHYSSRDQAILEEIVLANQQQMTLAEVAEAKRAGKGVLSFDTPDFYVKTRAEMAAAMGNWLKIATEHDPELAATLKAEGRTWLDRTLTIADSVSEFEPFKSGLHFPIFPVPEGETPESELGNRVWAKADARYPGMSERTRRLIAYELQCVQELGFAPYFLITEDFVDYARTQGIDVGLGRGSAPGSIVTYVLGITDVDPVYYGLSEGGIGLTRFLNPTLLYGMRENAFGVLDSACADAPLPEHPAMEQAITEALNARFRHYREQIKAGTDPESGKPIDAKGQAAWTEQLVRITEYVKEEWTLLRRWEEANAVAAAAQRETRYARGSLIGPLYRWLAHHLAGHPAGTTNEHNSQIAGFLGLTVFRARKPEGIPAILPDYEFRHSRKSMPDIDIDFTPGYDGREAVMRYVVEKYGADHVAQIATFGSLWAKSAIKDVARAKGLPPQEADALTLLIPKKFQAQSGDTGDEELPGVSLREMISSEHPAVVEGSRELRAAMSRDPKVEEIIRLAAQIEGMKRNVSTHACGVLITPTPVTDFVSVERTSSGTGTQAVHDGPTLTDGLGLLKVDFLGLKNLKVNRFTVDRITERSGEIVDWRRVPDDDPDAMKLLRDGRTHGIFQFASDFATGILKQMKPKRVQDLMVATALGRPGPMEYIPKYVEARAQGRGEYGDPVFERIAKPILEETYGILVYQEQVMLLAIDLAGFTLPESDGLRKATAKKDAALLAKYRDKFVDGAVRAGVDRAFIEHYWDAVLTPFAAYSFNKSHSTAYALTAYKQAYLKAKFPAEFLAALMTVDQNETTKERGATSPLAKAAVEARRLGLTVAPIDINRSTERIEIEGDGRTLRLSMAGIKGIGERPVRAIIEERALRGPYASMRDFILRTVETERETDELTGKKLPAAVNKTVVINLIKTGAFDELGDRGALLEVAEAYFGTTSVKKRAELDWSVPKAAADTIIPRDYLDWERELIGFYASAHPAASIPPERFEAFAVEQEALETRRARETGRETREVFRSSVTDCLAYERVRDPDVRVLAGVITGLRWAAFRSGNGGRLVGQFEDETGGCRIVIWTPKDNEPRAIREAFAALRDDPGSANGQGILVAAGFSFNPQYDKEPGLIGERWQIVPMAQLPAAPPKPAAAKKKSDPTVVAQGEQIEAGLAALFD